MNYHTQAVSLAEVKEHRPEYKEVHSQQDTLKRLDKAFKAFISRAKRGAKAGFPRFQGKYRFDSFTYPQYKQIPSGRVTRPESDSARVTRPESDTEKTVYLPKIGNVRIRLSRPLEGKVKTLTIKRDSCGDWFAVFTCELEPKPLADTGHEVGIDVGLSHLVVTSEGEKFEAPKHRKAEKALRKAQRRLARRKKGSARREKARLLVAKLHRKIQRQRADFLHKLSTYLMTGNDTLVLEDLKVKGLNKGMLAKSFNDVAIAQLTQMLTYKAEYAGRRVVRVDPCYTSQDCSCCGYRSGKKPLHIRKWTCSECNTQHHRDINAAKNIWARAVPLGDNVDVV